MTQHNSTDADIPSERDDNNHSVDDNKSSSEQPIDNSIANFSSYNPPRFDIVMIGNSNVRSINTILPNTTCKVIELRQKSLLGATKLSRNLKVCSKICIHQVGHGEMMKNSNDKIANDLANLIDITVEVQHISPDDIIICGIMHRDDQKVHTTNKLLSSVCIRKGCKFLVRDFKRHHYRDNVHLDSSGMELWLSQIAIHCSQILGVAYIQPTQSQNDKESASDTVLFNGKDHILSNHYPYPIQVDGKTFHSSEQLYQHKMAILGDYNKIAEDILHTRSASHAQRLGSVIQKDRDLGLSAR